MPEAPGVGDMQDPPLPAAVRRKKTMIGRTALVGAAPPASRLSEDVVQFSSAMFYARESDGCVVVELMRIGTGAVGCTVNFETQDGSAKEGHKYIKLQQRVEFAPGELLKKVQIKIVQDDFFDTTLEFQCNLDQPDQCLLGKYLHSCRVLILDDDTFPANRFNDDISEFIKGNEDALSKQTISLLFAYIRLTFMNVPTIWWKTLLVALLDQLHNIYYYWTIVIQVYLVDHVLGEHASSDDDAHHSTIAKIAMSYVLPNFVLIVTDRFQLAWLDMEKPIQCHLQVNLFRKYLNYTQESKIRAPVQDLTTAMDAEIPMLVKDGYMFLFALLQSLGKVVVVAVFVLREDRQAMIPILIFPVIVFSWTCVRQSSYVDLENRTLNNRASSTGLCVDASDNFALIRDYQYRQGFTEKYDKLLAQSFSTHHEMVIFRFWNGQVVPLTTILFAGTYMFIGAVMVLQGGLTLGSFLAMLSILKDMGNRFQNLYEILQAGVQVGSPLLQIARMLNLPTDLSERLERERRSRDFMKERLQQEEDLLKQNNRLRHNGSPSIFDRLPIAIEGASVIHAKAIRGITIDVANGKVVFVKGPHATGKGSCLRMIAGVENPSIGRVDHSSHNRILQVTHHPDLLLQLDLFENLTFGAVEVDSERVVRIFKRMGLDSNKWLLDLLLKNIATHEQEFVCESEQRGSLLDMFSKKISFTAVPTKDLDAVPLNKSKSSRSRGGSWDQPQPSRIFSEDSMTAGHGFAYRGEAGAMPWHTRLSWNEVKKLHLARAIVYNPEIMVLHKPLDGADSEVAQQLVQLLCEFVDNRGVELEDDDMGHRRPRTLFFSGGKGKELSNKDLHKADKDHVQMSIEHADIVWTLTADGQFQEEYGGRAVALGRRITH